MSVGTITLGATPCCGIIIRNYECVPDHRSRTGFLHEPFWSEYAPGPGSFEETVQLEQGICPDCGKNLGINKEGSPSDGWLVQKLLETPKKANLHITPEGFRWAWDFNEALDEFEKGGDEQS